MRPTDLTATAASVFGPQWDALSPAAQAYLGTLGAALEPFQLAHPAPPVAVTLGFECLAADAAGRRFHGIRDNALALGVPEPVLLGTLLIACLGDAEDLRTRWRRLGHDADRLLLTVNLDPALLAEPSLREVLRRHQVQHEMLLFEVNESTTAAQADQVLALQSAWGLHLALDDGDRMSPEVRALLAPRVRLAKLDSSTTRRLMKVHAAAPDPTAAEIARHRLAGKPYVVEGIESPDELRYLQRFWPRHGEGDLYVQGWSIAAGRPWDRELAALGTPSLPKGYRVREAR